MDKILFLPAICKENEILNFNQIILYRGFNENPFENDSRSRLSLFFKSEYLFSQR